MQFCVVSCFSSTECPLLALLHIYMESNVMDRKIINAIYFYTLFLVYDGKNGCKCRDSQSPLIYKQTSGKPNLIMCTFKQKVTMHT